MDLTARYLQAVRHFLPARARDEVLQTLKSEIDTEVRLHESHLQRPLTEDELAGIIQQRGHPYLVAQRYRPRWALIGPALLPLYWQAIKASLGVALLILTAVTAVRAASGTSPLELLGGLSAIFSVAVTIVTVLAVVFVVLDMRYGRAQLRGGWNARALPEVPADRATSPADALFALAGSGVFLIWWLTIPHYRWILLGPTGNLFTFSQSWQVLYWPIAAAIGLTVLLHFAVLVVPGSPIRRWRSIIADVISAVMLSVVLGAGDLIVAGPAGVKPDLLQVINKSIRAALAIGLCVAVVQIVTAGARLSRRRRRSSPAA